MSTVSTTALFRWTRTDIPVFCEGNPPITDKFHWQYVSYVDIVPGHDVNMG